MKVLSILLQNSPILYEAMIRFCSASRRWMQVDRIHGGWCLSEQDQVSPCHRLHPDTYARPVACVGGALKDTIRV